MPLLQGVIGLQTVGVNLVVRAAAQNSRAVASFNAAVHSAEAPMKSIEQRTEAANRLRGMWAGLGVQAGAALLTIAGTAGTAAESLERLQIASKRIASNAGISSAALNNQIKGLKAQLFTTTEATEAVNKLNIAQAAYVDTSRLAIIANDLATAKNLKAVDVLNVLTDAIAKASAESLNQVDIGITNSLIFTKIAKAQGKTAASLDMATRRQAVYNYILQKGATFQGAFADTADQASYTFRKLGVAAKAAYGSIGAGVLDVLKPVAQLATTLLDWFNSWSEGTKKFIGGTIAVVGGVSLIIGVIRQAINTMKLFKTLMAATIQFNATPPPQDALATIQAAHDVAQKQKKDAASAAHQEVVNRYNKAETRRDAAAARQARLDQEKADARAAAKVRQDQLDQERAADRATARTRRAERDAAWRAREARRLAKEQAAATTTTPGGTPPPAGTTPPAPTTPPTPRAPSGGAPAGGAPAGGTTITPAGSTTITPTGPTTINAPAGSTVPAGRPVGYGPGGSGRREDTGTPSRSLPTIIEELSAKRMAILAEAGLGGGEAATVLMKAAAEKNTEKVQAEISKMGEAYRAVFHLELQEDALLYRRTVSDEDKSYVVEMIKETLQRKKEMLGNLDATLKWYMATIQGERPGPLALAGTALQPPSTPLDTGAPDYTGTTPESMEAPRPGAGHQGVAATAPVQSIASILNAAATELYRGHKEREAAWARERAGITEREEEPTRGRIEAQSLKKRLAGFGVKTEDISKTNLIQSLAHWASTDNLDKVKEILGQLNSAVEEYFNRKIQSTVRLLESSTDEETQATLRQKVTTFKRQKGASAASIKRTQEKLIDIVIDQGGAGQTPMPTPTLPKSPSAEEAYQKSLPPAGSQATHLPTKPPEVQQPGWIAALVPAGIQPAEAQLRFEDLLKRAQAELTHQREKIKLARELPAEEILGLAPVTPGLKPPEESALIKERRATLRKKAEAVIEDAATQGRLMDQHVVEVAGSMFGLGAVSPQTQKMEWAGSTDYKQKMAKLKATEIAGFALKLKTAEEARAQAQKEAAEQAAGTPPKTPRIKEEEAPLTPAQKLNLTQAEFDALVKPIVPQHPPQAQPGATVTTTTTTTTTVTTPPATPPVVTPPATPPVVTPPVVTPPATPPAPEVPAGQAEKEQRALAAVVKARERVAKAEAEQTQFLGTGKDLVGEALAEWQEQYQALQFTVKKRTNDLTKALNKLKKLGITEPLPEGGVTPKVKSAEEIAAEQHAQQMKVAQEGVKAPFTRTMRASQATQEVTPAIQATTETVKDVATTAPLAPALTAYDYAVEEYQVAQEAFDESVQARAAAIRFYNQGNKAGVQGEALAKLQTNLSSAEKTVAFYREQVELKRAHMNELRPPAEPGEGMAGYMAQKRAEEALNRKLFHHAEGEIPPDTGMSNAAEEARQRANMLAEEARQQSSERAEEARQVSDLVAEEALQRANVLAEEGRQQSSERAEEARQVSDLIGEEARLKSDALAEEGQKRSDVIAEAARKESDAIALVAKQRSDALAKEGRQRSDALAKAAGLPSAPKTKVARAQAQAIPSAARLVLPSIPQTEIASYTKAVANNTAAINANVSTQQQVVQQAPAVVQAEQQKAKAVVDTWFATVKAGVDAAKQRTIDLAKAQGQLDAWFTMVRERTDATSRLQLAAIATFQDLQKITLGATDVDSSAIPVATSRFGKLGQAIFGMGQKAYKAAGGLLAVRQIAYSIIPQFAGFISGNWVTMAIMAGVAAIGLIVSEYKKAREEAFKKTLGSTTEEQEAQFSLYTEQTAAADRRRMQETATFRDFLFPKTPEEKQAAVDALSGTFMGVTDVEEARKLLGAKLKGQVTNAPEVLDKRIDPETVAKYLTAIDRYVGDITLKTIPDVYRVLKVGTEQIDKQLQTDAKSRLSIISSSYKGLMIPSLENPFTPESPLGPSVPALADFPVDLTGPIVPGTEAMKFLEATIQYELSQATFTVNVEPKLTMFGLATTEQHWLQEVERARRGPGAASVESAAEAASQKLQHEQIVYLMESYNKQLEVATKGSDAWGKSLEGVDDQLFHIQQTERGLDLALRPYETALQRAQAAASLVVIPLERQRREIEKIQKALQKQVDGINKRYDAEDKALEDQRKALGKSQKAQQKHLDAVRKRYEEENKALEKAMELAQKRLEVDQERAKVLDWELFIENTKNKIRKQETSGRELQLKTEKLILDDSIEMQQQALDKMREQLDAAKEKQDLEVEAAEKQIEAANAQMEALDEQLEASRERRDLELEVVTKQQEIVDAQAEALADQIAAAQEKVTYAQEELDLRRTAQSEARIALENQRTALEIMQTILSHAKQELDKKIQELKDLIAKAETASNPANAPTEGELAPAQKDIKVTEQFVVDLATPFQTKVKEAYQPVLLVEVAAARDAAVKQETDLPPGLTIPWAMLMPGIPEAVAAATEAITNGLTPTDVYSSIPGTMLLSFFDETTGEFSVKLQAWLDSQDGPANKINADLLKIKPPEWLATLLGGSGKSGVTIPGYATGFEGIVRRPTLMRVGEAGAEYVSVQPTTRESVTGVRGIGAGRVRSVTNNINNTTIINQGGTTVNMNGSYPGNPSRRSVFNDLQVAATTFQ